MGEPVRIIEAESAEQLGMFRELCLRYAASIPYDLECQGFSKEMATLPGKYAPPRGVILLALTAEGPVGCVAMRPLDDGACEMKRLYVDPAARGLGAGRKLCERLIALAAERGYRTMKLDTDASMGAAVRLYESLGFRRCSKYNDDPDPCTMWFELDLTGGLAGRA